MNFLKFSIKSLFFLSFFTLIHPNNFCEAMDESYSSSEEDSTPTTHLLTRRNTQTSSRSIDTGPVLLQFFSAPGRIQGSSSSSSEEDVLLPSENHTISDEDHFVAIYDRETEEGYSQTIPILDINPEHIKRRKINRLFDGLMSNQENSALQREENFETALVIYDLSRAPIEDPNSMEPDRWTDTAYFLNELDKTFFNRPICKKTIALIGLGAIEGGLAPWGISPLVMYLGENVLKFIPVGGVASGVLVYSIIGITTLPCMMQIGEFMNGIGNAIFDKNGFGTSKEDKGPHIQKTDFEIETRNQRCCQYVYIHTTVLSRIFSGMSAVCRALPMGLLWWKAETPFPGYRNIFFGPLLVFYLVKTYTESMDFYDGFSHQQMTEPLHMIQQKKKILRERIKTLERCVNAKASNRFVKELYDLIQGELRKKNLSEDGDSEEHISAFSALFVKLSRAQVFRHIRQQLEENVTLSMQPVVDNIRSLEVDGMVNLIGDIDKKRGKTGARTLLENLSTFDHGAATIGRFFVTSWAVKTVLMYMGVDPAIALYLSFGAAVIDVVSRAIGEWYVQKETFLGLRDICSTKMAFWPARWTTNTLSFGSAAFFSIPTVAIIFDVMSDCPLYVRSAVALATLPSEFSSFYTFFHDRYDRLISTVTTLRVRTTSQKREWLNSHIKQAKKFLHEADQSTIEQIYNLTQGGL